jgi:hypothetical protein
VASDGSNKAKECQYEKDCDCNELMLTEERSDGPVHLAGSVLVQVQGHLSSGRSSSSVNPGEVSHLRSNIVGGVAKRCGLDTHNIFA